MKRSPPPRKSLCVTSSGSRKGPGSAQSRRDDQIKAKLQQRRRQTMASSNSLHNSKQQQQQQCGASIENQMLVSVRTRPLSGKEVNRGERQVVTSYCTDKVVRISKAGRQGAVLRSEMGAMHEYQFDRVFGQETTQEEIYLSTTKEIVADTLGGKNCTVFAYGATGAGKTHTMMGTECDPGIIPRALVDIFAGIGKMQEDFAAAARELETEDWAINLSYLEVYNETIYDLLTDKQKPLNPCEDPADFRVKVLGLTETVVSSTDQVLELLRQGNARRRMESTAANQVSSRSHAVIQVKVERVHEQHLVALEPGRRRLAHEKGRRSVTSSTLSLIDLAGSERAAATQNRGARLREGANINKSLLALANCINALSSSGKVKARVKYRDSKLTHLLKSSLEGNCRLSMIAAINPSHRYYEESHNTLKYANRAKNIKIKASAASNRREEAAFSEEAQRLEALVAENQELRERLSLNLTSAAAATAPCFQKAASPSSASAVVSEADISLERMSIQSNTAMEDDTIDPVNSKLVERINTLEMANSKLLKTVDEQAAMITLQAKELKEHNDTIKRQQQHITLLEEARARKNTQQMPVPVDYLDNHQKPNLENIDANRASKASEYLFVASNAVAADDTRQDLSVTKELAKKKKKKNRRESFIPKPPSVAATQQVSKKRLSTDLQDLFPAKQQKISVHSNPSAGNGEMSSPSPLPNLANSKSAASSSNLSPFQRFTRRMRKNQR